MDRSARKWEGGEERLQIWMPGKLSRVVYLWGLRIAGFVLGLGYWVAVGVVVMGLLWWSRLTEEEEKLSTPSTLGFFFFLTATLGLSY